MNIQIKDSEAIISLSGRLDTASSQLTEEAIRKALNGVAGIEHICIDASELQYISSSGLRIILGLRKQYPEIQMLNVSKDVYKVLELTGISKLLTITRA